MMHCISISTQLKRSSNVISSGTMRIQCTLETLQKISYSLSSCLQTFTSQTFCYCRGFTCIVIGSNDTACYSHCRPLLPDTVIFFKSHMLCWLATFLGYLNLHCTCISTVPAIKKLPFSFRSVPYHRNGNDHETVRIHYSTRTFRTVYFHSYHLICTRNSCACAVRACKLVKYSILASCLRFPVGLA